MTATSGCWSPCPGFLSCLLPRMRTLMNVDRIGMGFFLCFALSKVTFLSVKLLVSTTLQNQLPSLTSGDGVLWQQCCRFPLFSPQVQQFLMNNCREGDSIWEKPKGGEEIFLCSYLGKNIAGRGNTLRAFPVFHNKEASGWYRIPERKSGRMWGQREGKVCMWTGW